MNDVSITEPQLHSSIVAMISLASGIASRHPDMGLCQLERLRQAGVPEHQINAVVEIARHIRDEASEKLDCAFDEKSAKPSHKIEKKLLSTLKVAENQSCCTPTSSGQSCC